MATLFVSPFGDNTSPGTLDAPFRTIKKGVEGLTAPGDVLYLRGGSYAEDVTIAGKHGELGTPIVIRAYGREHVSIDGAEPIDAEGHESHFRVGGNDEWKPATDEDPDAHPDEYLSVRTFPPGGEGALLRHGAFMDREPYTRLITYSRLEDLRAENEAFGRLPLDDPLPPFPGFPVVKVDKNGNVIDVGFKQPDGTRIDTFKHPWVYMGPGLLYDEEAGRIHVRLSHTHNNVPGIVDYDGGTDPRQVRLAISHRAPAPLVVKGCSFLYVDHLDVRFGGDRTIRIENSSDVVLDHLRVWAANEGIRLTDGATGVVLRHCEVRGGIPTWMFRSDIKDVYQARDGNSVLTDDLGHGTSQTLLSGTPDVVGTVVHNCEFVDGHDLFMFGQHTRFHHNLIDNVHDDGLVVETEGSDALEVDQNVIMRCLEAIGFAKKTEVGGSRSIHHNLIDLRNPTAGIRPRPSGHLISKDDVNKDGSVFRYGQLYKSNKPDGALDLFHNTCLVAHQFRLAGIQHYANSEGDTRRSANNIYADVTPSPENSDNYASAFLPHPDFPGPTDGNFYFQLPKQHLRLLRHVSTTSPRAIGRPTRSTPWRTTATASANHRTTLRTPTTNTVRPSTRRASRRTAARAIPSSTRSRRTACPSSTTISASRMTAPPATTASNLTPLGSPIRSPRPTGNRTWAVTSSTRWASKSASTAAAAFPNIRDDRPTRPAERRTRLAQRVLDKHNRPTTPPRWELIGYRPWIELTA